MISYSKWKRGGGGGGLYQQHSWQFVSGLRLLVLFAVFERCSNGGTVSGASTRRIKLPVLADIKDACNSIYRSPEKSYIIHAVRDL